MMALVLLAVLFVCGLINSVFFLPPKKVITWIQSFPPISRSCTSITPPASVTVMASDKKKESAHDRAELRNIFATFDKNSDGFINKEELTESLKNIGISTTDAEVKDMIERLDANKDGLIDLDEFCKLYDSVGKPQDRGRKDGEEGSTEEEDGGVDQEMELKEAFDVFDGNKDGLITVEELSLVLESLGLKQGWKSEDCKEMIRSVDMDGDGMVNFEEFKKMMMKAGGCLVSLS
ncbi:PREDICTED: calmodulin-like protein 3 [Nelumbo nucifera]|uniref:Calmodulin-like protein 3 n=1 Tax=Nelumbo nucifera TaxID=4432 RepID=A0A1U7YNM9_NELNU|nr:PREDICTED: calmodulin-like protein 3 [Nelumbo nucifera]